MVKDPKELYVSGLSDHPICVAFVFCHGQFAGDYPIAPEISNEPYFKMTHDRIIVEDQLEKCSGFERNLLHREITKAAAKYARKC